MEISIALVQRLRSKTGAGILDCKKALEATNGDIDEAVDWLRKKGLSAAAKKADRIAAEGLVGVAVNGNIGTIVEVNAETDFVSKNEKFVKFVKELTNMSFGHNEVQTLIDAEFDKGETVESFLNTLVATIGEKMSVRRIASLAEPFGGIASYVHNSVDDTLGKIGVLVGIKGDNSKVDTFGRQVAMHIAASAPLALDRTKLDPAVIEHERQVQMDIARNSGKPEEIIEKMVEGRIRKYYEEVCLLDQAYALNPDITVQSAADAEGVEITGFVRFALGEGIEKKQENFADEVAKAIK